MPENRKTVLLETLEKYRHVTVNDNMRFIVEIFSKLECEVLKTGSARMRPPTSCVGPTIS